MITRVSFAGRCLFSDALSHAASKVKLAELNLKNLLS